ncbi:MAG: hypothetical protein LBE84_07540, partial [Planctomycetota bacterium]|nr:hypothetical protein [Planctomycetota bacterium]
NAAAAIEAERRRNGPFKDIFDFAARFDSRAMNKGTIEALIKSGAMDSLSRNRAGLMAGLETALKAGAAEQKAKAVGQLGLFSPGELPVPALPAVPEWTEQQKLQFEKDVLGFYLTSHPLAQHAKLLETFASASIADLADMANDVPVILGGLVSSVRIKTDKKGRRFASIELEDMNGRVRGVVFASVYEEMKEFIAENRIVFVEAALDKSRDEPSLKVNAVIPLEQAAEKLAERAILRFQASELTETKGKLERLRDIVARRQGQVWLVFSIESAEGCVDIRAGEAYRFHPAPKTVEAINDLFGPEALSLRGRRRPA